MFSLLLPFSTLSSIGLNPTKGIITGFVVILYQVVIYGKNQHKLC